MKKKLKVLGWVTGVTPAMKMVGLGLKAGCLPQPPYLLLIAVAVAVLVPTSTAQAATCSDYSN